MYCGKRQGWLSGRYHEDGEEKINNSTQTWEHQWVYKDREKGPEVKD
jgi:hypothetical protein